jgi:hypothetical protein
VVKEKLKDVQKESDGRFKEMSIRPDRMQGQVVTTCKKVERTICNVVTANKCNS